MKISRSELMHQKLQAAIRENDFPSHQLMYLGLREDSHWYLIAGKHEVPAENIEDFERQEDPEE